VNNREQAISLIHKNKAKEKIPENLWIFLSLGSITVVIYVDPWHWVPPPVKANETFMNLGFTRDY